MNTYAGRSSDARQMLSTHGRIRTIFRSTSRINSVKNLEKKLQITTAWRTNWPGSIILRRTQEMVVSGFSSRHLHSSAFGRTSQIYCLSNARYSGCSTSQYREAGNTASIGVPFRISIVRRRGAGMLPMRRRSDAGRLRRLSCMDAQAAGPAVALGGTPVHQNVARGIT
jgi:hypothetical protein